MRVFLLAVAAVALSGCSTVSGWMNPSEGVVFGREEVVVMVPDTPNPMRSESSDSAPPREDLPIIDIEVEEYRLPNEPEGQEGAESDPMAVVRGERANYRVSPTQQDFLGGAVVYNYVPDMVYRIFVAPFRVTDITLQPGERLVTPPASGDSMNFVVGTAHSMQNGERVEHVYVKPVHSQRSTSLTLNTNKRVYQLEITSFDITFMPIVRWRYPLDEAADIRREAEQQRNEIFLEGNIESFDFGYEIIPHHRHRPAWMPSVVFTDGRRTYFQFASAYRASYAPVLFSIEGGERVLVNYRVVGDYYIADRVIDHAELVLDVNAGNIITVKRLPR